MISFFTKKEFSSEKLLYIKWISLIFIIIFSVVLVKMMTSALSDIESGFSSSNPLTLIIMLLMVCPLYLLPIFFIALLFKLKHYIFSLVIVIFSFLILFFSWQFAYKNEIFFSVYRWSSSFFENIDIPRFPQNTLILNETSFPSEMHTSRNTLFYDRYFLQINYPTFELKVTGKITAIRSLNRNIEYSYFSGKQCAGISMIPKQSQSRYKDAIFQNVQCRNNLTCIVIESPREMSIYADDDNRGCLFLQAQNEENHVFSVSQLLEIINTAQRP